MPRFFQPNLDNRTLTGEEAHHCRDVLRLQTGDELELFDGRGNAVRCRVGEMSKREVQLTALERRNIPALPVGVTLAVAVIKKNMDFIVQKATELGVAAIVPVVTERTIARPDKSTRWREIALEACKQCGNNWLPEIAEPVSLKDFLPNAGRFELKLVAALRPGARPMKSVMAPVRSVCVLVGPEGDFTMGEYEAIGAAGFLPVTLGSLVLRADTAALYALSVVHHELVTHRDVC
jgi:16S rRNA (uracil1498-N3)-methyltransferase